MKTRAYAAVVCDLSDTDIKKLQAIAERDGITLEDALNQAVQNFLTKGVQTPKKARILPHHAGRRNARDGKI